MNRWFAAFIGAVVGIAGILGFVGTAVAKNAAPAGIDGLAGIDVLIDAGHGGIDGGTLYGDLTEKQINLAVALNLFERLRQSGLRVALNRSKDYALSDDNRWLNSRSRHLRDLAQRKLVIDALKPRITVSLHANWSARPDRRGPSVLYQTGNPTSALAASLIQAQLNGLYGTRTRSHAGKTFYLLNRPTSPAVIVEMGYISNPADRAMMTEPAGQNKIAEAIRSAILQYLFISDLCRWPN